MPPSLKPKPTPPLEESVSLQNTLSVPSLSGNTDLVKTILTWVGMVILGLVLLYGIYWICNKLYLLFIGETKNEPITNNGVYLDPASRDELIKAVVKALQPMYGDVIENERNSRQEAQREASNEKKRRMALEEDVERLKREAGPTIDPLD